ncbi:16S rRNA (adenine(1518)-N(6)/adenine(1519)-N(6))-dimethyltransferase RsmA [Methylomonas sp. MED-D]|uniref:16S rRNA (adenine(1518)-N(6)/adenine(1519)-N(6))- dimethyltransferase RsmA n=1 Tax=unclassified Methylomonas TaxID=2608980 RepID=UPI001438F0E5|nr:16S rRNA (adenine(1518)-N(6)/adenine(1519)-N(6))-dimethyltransferase RsmA [Methylomonas sp. MV1]MDT4330195.1 16S rRNA (adenine(1518)-N(6)/adenine(1519)-N(6))-dimethyltransferase RsmA [Methylomonas sp. MV1]NJA05627.1 16S rRNA (adenine(1518)-N(6)/adenine(1519)-N(6))-dimethyltransferase RsmA [Methylococcaceae bacterium WWC4]
MTHQPRKRFGQNFLHDSAIINNILAHAHPAAGEHWVEIGPGLGALTKPLLDSGIRLDVVELDRDLVARLQKQYAGRAELTIHSADALTFDFAALAQPGEKLRVIGNLPYNISTPLMFHLVENTRCIEDMHFMLQKEVVERICAEPGGKQYGRLSVMMQYFCETEALFDVPPESFDPAPKVMSAIVRLAPHAQAPVDVANFRNFSQLVGQAFTQRRKTIRNSLKGLVGPELFERLGIDANLRAESISLAEFARLANHADFQAENP